MKKMKKVCAVLCAVLSVLLLTSAFAGEDNGLVLNGGTPATGNVRWKTIVGNITVSNNDAVGGIDPGTTPWSTLGGGRTPLHVATIRHFRPRAPLQESSAKVGISSARARAQ